MCKFEANRCGSHDHMADNLSELHNVLTESSFSFFQLNADFFQRILYLYSAKDDVIPLMCKFEANRCGFRVAENRPLGTFMSFRQQCNHFRSSNSTQIFSKESYT